MEENEKAQPIKYAYPAEEKCEICLLEKYCDGIERPSGNCMAYEPKVTINEEPQNLEDKIKVMTAYKNGKSIQSRLIGGTWQHCNLPQWNWSEFEYRVTPMTKLIDAPYETIEEVLNDMRDHGPFIEFSKTVYNQPKAVIMLDGTPIVECETRAYHSVNAKDLMKCNWQDGKKCCKAKMVEVDDLGRIRKESRYESGYLRSKFGV